MTLHQLFNYLQTKTLSINPPNEHLFTAVNHERDFDINVTLIGLIRQNCYRIIDLKGFHFLSQDVANGLQNLLDYDGDVEDDFGLSFQVSVRMVQEILQKIFSQYNFGIFYQADTK